MFKRFFAAAVFVLLGLVSVPEAAQAACTVPNTLTNGTTADATAVMGNFTSLAGCAAPLSAPAFTGTISVTSAASQYAQATVQSGAGTGSGYGAVIKVANTAGHLFQQLISDGGSPTFYYTETGMLTMSTDAGFGIKINTNATDNNGLRIATSGATSCYPSCSNVSDKRIKTDIANLLPASGLTAINALRPVSYKWKDARTGTEQQIGLIAQDVRTVFPQVVTNTGIITKDAPDGILALNYSALTAPIVLAIQQLDGKVEALSNRTAHMQAAAMESPANLQAAIRRLQAGNLEQAHEISLLRAQRQTERDQYLDEMKALRAANNNEAAELQILQMRIRVIERKTDIQTAQK
jgi:hypothetical protein